MPFREDEDARVELVASLEEENERLRAELRESQAQREKAEHPEPEAKPEAKPARRDKPRAAAPGGAWRRLGWGFALVAAAIAGVVLVPRCLHHLKHSTGSIQDMFWVDGALTVQIEYLGKTSTTTDLESFDLATGARLGTVDLGNLRSLPWPHDGARTWVVTHDRQLELVDVRAPAIVVSPSALPKKIPELAAGYKVQARDPYQLEDGSIANRSSWTPTSVGIVLADGTRAWLDTTPALLRAYPGPALTPRVGYTCRIYDSASCEQRRCFTWAAVTGSTAKQLAWSPDWQHDLTPSTTEPSSIGGLTVTRTGKRNPPELASPDAARLIEPAFIERLDRPCAAELGGGVLVRHASAAVGGHTIVSLLDARGAIAWSIPVSNLGVDADTPLGAIVKADVIYLILGDHGSDPGARERLWTKKLELAHVSTAGRVLARYQLW